jgi:Bcr/CflA subfamily drug resistance transporter
MNKKSLKIFVWLLVAYEIVIYLSMDAYMPALPRIAHVFGVSVSAAQMTVIVWMIGALIPQLVIGPLTDRYGRRPIILVGGIVYIIASLLCAFAPSMDTLLAGRFLQGLAMPTMYIAGYASINEYFDKQAAIRILALMNGVTILAPAFGPILGGAFLLFFSWRIIFIILAVAAMITILLLVYYMPETLAKEKRSSSLHLGRIFGEYTRVCMNKVFMSASFITFLPTIGLIAWMLAGPFIIIKQFHLSTLDFGLLQGIIFAGFIVGTKIVSRYVKESLHKSFIASGMLLMLAGSISAAGIDWLYPSALMWMVLSLSVSTCGTGLMIPILSRLTFDTSKEPMGIKVTIFSVIRVGTGLAGSLCISYFYNGTLLSIAMIMLAFGLLASFLWALNYKNVLKP